VIQIDDNLLLLFLIGTLFLGRGLGKENLCTHVVIFRGYTRIFILVWCQQSIGRPMCHQDLTTTSTRGIEGAFVVNRFGQLLTRSVELSGLEYYAGFVRLPDGYADRYLVLLL
jgi:hypothetical protein